MTQDRLVGLPDGRRLAYAEYGAPLGVPVLYCHGTPGSRLGVTPTMAGQATAAGVRLIVPDRPGYGLSDPQPDRTLPDWPLDAACLLDALDIERCGVAGYSMGGVYALACARLLAERIAAVALLGSLAPNVLSREVADAMPPSGVDILRLARDAPATLLQGLAPLARAPDQLFAMLADSFAPVDQTVLRHPEVQHLYRQDCREALRQGASAMVRDYVLLVGEWGFDLEDVLVPVSIRQGMADLNAPPSMSEYLAGRLPNRHHIRLADEGHLAHFGHWQAVLADLIAELAP